MNFSSLTAYNGVISLSKIVHSVDGDKKKAPYVVSITVYLDEISAKKNERLFKEITNGISEKQKNVYLEIEFTDVVYLEVLDEYYADFPEYKDVGKGHVFRTYSQSGYLEFLLNTRLTEHLESEYNFNHFSIYGINHIVEVITLSNPTVRLV